MVEDEPAFEHDLLHVAKARTQQGLLLLSHRHVQLVVRHAAFAEEVIADKVGTTRAKHLLGLRVEHWSVALVAKLMNRLVGNDKLKLAQALRPRGLMETALDKLNSISQIAKPLRRQLMHG